MFNYGNLIMKNDASPSSSDGGEYFRLFNSRNAKLTALILLIVISVYHALLKLKYGEDTCVGLLKEGRFQGDHIWQPYGCMLHMYSLQNSRMCMKYSKYWGHQNWITFIGDRRVRQLFVSVIGQLKSDEIGRFNVNDRNDVDEPFLMFEEKELNLTVEYFFHPKLDLSVVTRLKRYTFVPPSGRPSVLVIGAGLESIKETNGTLLAAKEYSSNVSRLLPYVTQLYKNTTILWMPIGPVDERKLSKTPFSAVSNEGVYYFNNEAENILSNAEVKLWRSSKLLSVGYNGDSKDGMEIGETALKYQTQILLNFYCNDLMNFPDGTCCSRTEPLTVVQITSFLFFTACICLTIVYVGMKFLRYQCNSTVRSPQYFDKFVLPNGDTLGCMNDSVVQTKEERFTSSFMISWSKICALLLFCYACDRANVYMKENVWFTLFNFFMPVLYLTVLGLFFTEVTRQTGLMHREQTDEWKGWMQLVILVYHVVGAGKVLWIYMLIRCLISSYLFLLGYGHFLHFWTTGDFHLRRLFSVLFRYNLLVLTLCVTMNRPYQFYFFVPLITYWFVVIYVVLAIPPQITSASSDKNPMHYFAMVVKFIILYGLISVLYLSEVFFENIFVTRPWKALFVMSDDSIQQWWFRWWLDRYSVANGMAFAFLTTILRRQVILTDGQPCNLFTKRLTILAFVCSLGGLALYGVIISRCRSHPDCTEVHAYISFIPIVSYLLIRNVFGALRSRVSTFFAWFGRISLEIFTIQNHILLAADGNGVLVLLPRWPVLNVIITSFVFVCVAHEIHSVTYRLVPVIVPPDSKTAIRNLLLLVAVCVPLCFLYGML